MFSMRSDFWLTTAIIHNIGMALGMTISNEIAMQFDRKSHWGFPEIPRGSAVLTGVTQDSDAVGGAFRRILLD